MLAAAVSSPTAGCSEKKSSLKFYNTASGDIVIIKNIIFIVYNIIVITNNIVIIVKNIIVIIDTQTTYSDFDGVFGNF